MGVAQEGMEVQEERVLILIKREFLSAFLHFSFYTPTSFEIPELFLMILNDFGIWVL